MEAVYSYYDFTKSVERIDEILNSSDSNYQDKKNIPSKDNLTFTNGFYVDVTVLCVDIRGSKELANKHTRPVLAKVYRAYISEVIAVIKGHSKVSQIYIEGDGIWAVFETPSRSDIDEVFSIASSIASLVDIYNFKLNKKKYSELTIGIGIDHGSALLIKAGYKGSTINDVVWLGKTVGQASQLCSFGNKAYNDKEIMVSDVLYSNLNEHNQSLLQKNHSRDCYHGNVINTKMQEWIEKNS